MGIVTYGLIFTLCSKWIELGYISQMSEVISPVKTIVYLLFVIFDLSFICKTVSVLEGEYFGYNAEGPRLEFQKIFILGFVVVLFFALLLYLGKPISKGFHKGYYKTRGDHYTKKVISVKATSEVKSSGSDSTSDLRKIKKSAMTEEELNPMKANKATFFGIGEESAGQGDSSANKESTSPMKSELPITSEKSFSYQSIIGYAGSFCLAIAFLLQAFNASGMKTLNDQPLMSFVLFCVGFVFLFVYGISLKLAPITILSLFSFLICAGIIFLKLKASEL